jgi:hypothetical protein
MTVLIDRNVGFYNHGLMTSLTRSIFQSRTQNVLPFRRLVNYGGEFFHVVLNGLLSIPATIHQLCPNA